LPDDQYDKQECEHGGCLSYDNSKWCFVTDKNPLLQNFNTLRKMVAKQRGETTYKQKNPAALEPGFVNQFLVFK